jgi:hypothetical protein
MTESLPTFAKISNLLDYYYSNKEVEKVSMFNKEAKKKIAEPINLLKYCDSKYNKIITMRYHSYPNYIHFPFLSYYHELIFN